MNPALQFLETRGHARLVERDDLTIEHERGADLPGPALQRVDDLRKLARFLVAEPRPETHAMRGDLDDRADAVVFRFVDELRIVERRVGERRQHRSESHCCEL
jgi:hypothetical protein